MGQPIVVSSTATARPGVWRFDTNRVLTGMAYHRYRRDTPVVGDRPPDELARRLFEQGSVDEVHIYGNAVTVTLARSRGPEGIAEIIEGLYTYYREGVTPAIP